MLAVTNPFDKTKNFPLMCLFELQDIFAIKSIKTSIIQFNITNYINFNSASTRSSATNKLIPPHNLNNTSQHSYFYRLPSLWNAMSVFDLNMSFGTLRSKLKSICGNIFESFDNALYIISARAQDATNLGLLPFT